MSAGYWRETIPRCTLVPVSIFCHSLEAVQVYGCLGGLGFALIALYTVIPSTYIPRKM